MPGQNKFNIGGDATLQIVAGDGSLLKPALLTEFKYNQQTIDLKSRPLNARVIHTRFPDGWAGHFLYDRSDPSVDQYFADGEEDFYAGFRGADVYINQIIRETDQSITSWQFSGVAMQLADGGTYKQDDKVMQRIEWMASARIRKV